MANILKNPCWLFKFVWQKSKFFKEVQMNKAGEIQCSQGIDDFEESVFDQNVFRCTLTLPDLDF